MMARVLLMHSENRPGMRVPTKNWTAKMC